MAKRPVRDGVFQRHPPRRQRSNEGRRVASAVRLDAGNMASSVEQQLERDSEAARLRGELTALRKKYEVAIKSLDAERERTQSLTALRGIAPRGARLRGRSRRKHRATMLLMVSDVHAEERVDPATVNGMNDYSLAVCDRRMAELRQRFFAMLDHERQLADIRRVMIWIGGDVISGHIHPDTAELAQLAPLAACRWVGSRLRHLIDTAADNADEVVVATNSGNHGRSTEKLRIGTETEHSFEQNLYLMMAAEEKRPNVSWHVGAGYLNYVDLDGFVVRCQHGHAIKYSGGSYGLALPATKAIAGWDSVRRADLNIWGHYHTFGWLRAARYVSNGSVIGHSAYATVRVRAGYERPCQGAVVIDHERNEVTKAYPIFCDGDLA